MVVGFSQVETDKLAYYSRPSHLPSLAICPPLLFSCWCFFRIHKWAGGQLKGWAKEKQPFGGRRSQPLIPIRLLRHRPPLHKHSLGGRPTAGHRAPYNRFWWWCGEQCVRSPRMLFLQNTANRRHRRSQSAAVLPSRRQQQKTSGEKHPKGSQQIGPRPYILHRPARQDCQCEQCRVKKGPTMK